MTAPDATPAALDAAASPLAPAASVTEPATEPAILLERVSRWYGNVVAVNDISFALGPGRAGVFTRRSTGRIALTGWNLPAPVHPSEFFRDLT